MPDISMCQQRCDLSDKCKRHKDSGTKPNDYQWYDIYEAPPKNNPDKCRGWWPVNEMYK